MCNTRNSIDELIIYTSFPFSIFKFQYFISVMEANTELVKLRHKQFFQNFICDSAEQALVPDDVATRPVVTASLTKRVQGSGVSMRSNSSVKNADNEKEVKGSEMLKIDQVLGPKRTTCYLGGGRLLHTIVSGSLYGVEDLEPSR